MWGKRKEESPPANAASKLTMKGEVRRRIEEGMCRGGHRLWRWRKRWRKMMEEKTGVDGKFEAFFRTIAEESIR